MIAGSEYAERRRRLAALAEREGLDGVLVVSRGGSTFDRYADALYLTGHYQSYSYLPDAPNLFSARAHTALVLAADATNVLCVSVPELDRDRVNADEVRHGADFAATLTGAVDDLRLDGKRLGLIGADVLPVRYWRQITDRLPAVAWTDCDE